MTQENTQREIEITAHDVPLTCPMPDQVKWNQHPRVFLDVASTGKALCPYCGTTYRLKPGEVIKAH